MSRLQVGQYHLHLRDPYAIFPAEIHVHASSRSTASRRHVLGHRYTDVDVGTTNVRSQVYQESGPVCDRTAASACWDGDGRARITWDATTGRVSATTAGDGQGSSGRRAKSWLTVHTRSTVESAWALCVLSTSIGPPTIVLDLDFGHFETTSSDWVCRASTSWRPGDFAHDTSSHDRFATQPVRL